MDRPVRAPLALQLSRVNHRLRCTRAPPLLTAAARAVQMADVANFCNAFPNVEMAFDVEDSDDITAGDPVSLIVTLEREGEEDEDEPEGGWGKVRTDKTD